MHFKVYSRYFYSRLDDNEKKIYDKLLEGWLNYKDCVTVKGVNINVDFDKILKSLFSDNPELFYINPNAVSINMSPGILAVSVKFLYTQAQSEHFKSEIANVISNVQSLLVSGVDKEKTVHDYIAENVKYSKDLNETAAHTIKGALVDGYAVCDGFSKAFKLLCDAAGIPCILISGTATNSNGETERHAWNIVRKNKKNYHVDVTWNSTLSGLSGFPLYYNVHDGYISRNHFWQENIWPKCTDSSEIDKRIIPVTGKKVFGNVLTEKYKSKTKVFAVSFNKKFKSDREILNIVNEIATSKFFRVKSVSLTYQPDLDCAVIWFNYWF